MSGKLTKAERRQIETDLEACNAYWEEVAKLQLPEATDPDLPTETVEPVMYLIRLA